MRIGMGYDVHRLVPDRDLIIGGVKIPYEKGLLGHSDADVMLHAVMDALLGAAALGDIGKHFPDTDPAYKGISSVKLLEHVGKLIEEKGYIIGNIDENLLQWNALCPFLKHFLIAPIALFQAFRMDRTVLIQIIMHPVNLERRFHQIPGIRPCVRHTRLT